MRFKNIVFVLMLVIFLGACRSAEKPLRMADVPGDDATVKRQAWEPIIDYLSDGLGREIEFVIVSDYTALIEAMKYGHLDVGYTTSAGYVMALDEGVEIEPLIKAVKSSTGLAGYTSLLIARAETDVSDLSALTFAFVDVGSTSGYIVPSVWLEKQGIEPREKLIAGAHNAVILAVNNGTVDIGATASHRYREAIKNGVFTPDEVVVVWESELIPGAPLVIRSSLPQELKTELTQLFLDMPVELLEGRKVDDAGFVRAFDSDYDPIREILEFKNR